MYLIYGTYVYVYLNIPSYFFIILKFLFTGFSKVLQKYCSLLNICKVALYISKIYFKCLLNIHL